MIPVITTDNEKEDKNGIYYVKPNDEKELLKKINFVLENKINFNRSELSWSKVSKEFVDSIK